jgi:carboxyl-terminal processing protease
MEQNQNNQTEEPEKRTNKNVEKNRKIFKKYVSFFAVFFLVVASFYLGFNRGQESGIGKNVPLIDSVLKNKTATKDEGVDFSLFWKVWDLVKEKHVDRDKLDAQKMVYGAINGMLGATGDPYSSFFSPEEAKSFSEDIGGSFEGIGAELGIKDQILTVIAPLDNSPAEKAGLRAGDKILKIDGKVSTDFSIEEAVKFIRGKKGTPVVLNVISDGADEPRDVTVTRDTIEVKTVKLEFKDNDIAYLKVSKFGDTTDKEFSSAVDQIISKGAKGIVLDLRNNPGGLLDKSVTVASRMIPKGKVVVMEEDNSGKRDKLFTLGGDKLSSIPTVVLINEGSASASEILAGALRDDQGLTLIGKKSFGKGSVQELMNLKGGGSVKITVAKWLTPKGDYIMEKGINPDIDVELSLDDYKNKRDPQLDKALEVIGGKIENLN